VRHDALDRLRAAFRPDAARGERLTVQIVLTDGDAPGAIWLDVHDGRLDVGEGRRAAPDLTFRLACRDLRGVLEGTVNPDLLFMEERLEVEGELSLALKLRKLFRAPA
jgi:predicted lipid carrier protein YhbT